MLTNSIIQEIINREYERYQLVDCGIPPIDTHGYAQEWLSRSMQHNEFTKAKSHMLAEFYSHIQYVQHVECRKTEADPSEAFALYWHRYLRKQLGHLEKQARSLPLKQELKTQKAVDYSISNALFAEMFMQFCTSPQAFDTPYHIEDYWTEHVDATYPLGFGQFVERLQLQDGYFLGIASDFFIYIAKSVTKSLGNTSNTKKEVMDELPANCYMALNDMVSKQGNIWADVVHFRNYVYKTCLHMAHKMIKDGIAQHSRFRREETLPDIACEEALPPDHQESMPYIASVLLGDKSNPLYQRIVGRDEDKFQTFVAIKVQGVKYEDYVRQQHPHKAQQPQWVHKEAQRLRQLCSRMQQTLQQRVSDILKQEDGNL